MKNFVKFYVISLVFFITFSTKSIAADRILPIAKPSVDEDVKKRTSKKKQIYPQKKPQKVGELEIETSQETIEEIVETKEEVVIYPEKKPLVFKKKIDKAVAKSEILSKKDFKIAKSAFEAIDKKKMANSFKNISKS